MLQWNTAKNFPKRQYLSKAIRRSFLILQSYQFCASPSFTFISRLQKPVLLVIVCLDRLFCLAAKIPVIANSLLLLKRELCLRETWHWRLWDSPISLRSFLHTPVWIYHPPPSLASFPLGPAQSLFSIPKNNGMSPIDRKFITPDKSMSSIDGMSL